MAATNPVQNRPKKTAVTEGTAAMITLKRQKTKAEAMYNVRRPKVSEIGEQNIPPRV